MMQRIGCGLDARPSHQRYAGVDGGEEALWAYSIKGGDPAAGSPTATLLRLHPSHRSLLRRLPLQAVGSPTSGANDSHGVTGGVYKTRERIHRGMLIRDY